MKFMTDGVLLKEVENVSQFVDFFVNPLCWAKVKGEMQVSSADCFLFE